MLRRLVHSRWVISSRLWLVVGLLAASLVLLALVIGSGGSAETRASRLLGQARTAAWNGADVEALELVERALQARPEFGEALLFAAETTTRLHRPSVALGYLDRIHADFPEYATAQRVAGEVRLQLGQALAAEANFREALRKDATDRTARLKLMFLLRIEGRTRELAEHVRTVLQTGSCPAEFLFATAWPDHMWIDAEDRAFVQRCQQQAPGDAVVGLGVAVQSVLTPATHDSAVRLMRELLAAGVAVDEVTARLGTLLVDAGRWKEFATWNASLASPAEMHPQIWYLRGLGALQTAEKEQAIRCFWEALRRSPQHSGATYQLAQLLAGTADSEAATLLAQQSRQLNELRRLVVYGKGHGGAPDAEVIEQIATVLESLGREWEAVGWSLLELEAASASPTAEDRIRRLRPRLTPNHPLVLDTADLTRRIDLGGYPLPTFAPAASVTESSSSLSATEPMCRFVEVAREQGINFHFHQRDRSAEPNGHMFEISSGGVGILDFDFDGWPDLYLSQGRDWPPDVRKPAPQDQLLRNLDGVVFTDVSAASAIRESDYGQGVAVGDVNDDGFPDIFVANIGPCRLWINQGDGTFVERHEVTIGGRDQWAMSAAIADVNSDGWPDIYVVNYLGRDSLKKTCEREGVAVQCRPTMFTGEQSRLYINQGDGRFSDGTADSGLIFPDGKGMGVIAADFDGSGRLSLYVSNDTTQNAFFKNVIARAGDPPQFEECGMLLGVGFGDDGQPQASMGIAADDINRDGRLDLLVTNFVGQGCNLFVQQGAGSFSDLTRVFRVYAPSLHQMGWGAQFIDANLDGDPDLIVANGHLEDYTRFGIVSKMPTQFFLNVKGRRFEEQPAAQLGPYFSERHFGRTVVRLDWNRDGREDVLVTHVDAPVALLRNDTSDAGHGLTLRLVATSTARDAIGTHVTVTAGERQFVRQLVAGDGYQCSNQRQLVVGLGTHDGGLRLHVAWPSGRKQDFVGVPSDCEIMLIEGRDDWRQLKSQPPR